MDMSSLSIDVLQLKHISLTNISLSSRDLQLIIKNSHKTLQTIYHDQEISILNYFRHTYFPKLWKVKSEQHFINHYYVSIDFNKNLPMLMHSDRPDLKCYCENNVYKYKAIVTLVLSLRQINWFPKEIRNMIKEFAIDIPNDDWVKEIKPSNKKIKF